MKKTPKKLKKTTMKHREHREYQESMEHEDQNIEKPSGKKKKGKDWFVNRLMAGGGVILLGFTLFYANVVADFMNRPAAQAPTEPTTQVPQETEPVTEAPVNENLFHSPYADTKISEETKNTINSFVAGESVVTGIAGTDEKVSEFQFLTIDTKASQYEKLKNVYDYMLKHFELKDEDDMDGEQDTQEEDEEENEDQERLLEEQIENIKSELGFMSLYDVELALRAGRLLEGLAGSAQDFAATYALMLRKLGFDAYYIAVEENEDSSAYGYAVLKSYGTYYIFDPASELVQMERNESIEPEYTFFCLKQAAGQEAYQIGNILSTVTQYQGFAVLEPMRFEVMFSNGTQSVFGEVAYDGEDSVIDVKGDLQVSMGDTVNMAGTAKGTTGKNTWKLSAAIYDEDYNYIDEYEIYKDTTDSAYNETSFHTTEGGYIELRYSVTDINGRTCIITHTFEIK